MLPHDGHVPRILDEILEHPRNVKGIPPGLSNFCKSSDEYGVPGKAQRKMTLGDSHAPSEPSPSLDMVANFVMGGRRRRCFARRLRAVVELAASADKWCHHLSCRGEPPQSSQGVERREPREEDSSGPVPLCVKAILVNVPAVAVRRTERKESR